MIHKNRNYLLGFIFLAAHFILVLQPVFANDNQTTNAANIRVTTQNLYVGADVPSLMAISDPIEFMQKVGLVLQTIQQTNFYERAEAIADQIAATEPDIIGLQEVSLIRNQMPGDFLIGNPQAAEYVLYDYLDILMNALSARGLDYHVAAVVQDLDIEVPAIVGFDPTSGPIFMDVRLTDHDVILARGNVRTSNVFAKNYEVNLPVDVLGTTITVTRSYVAVDARVGGETYRVVNTHLEQQGEGMMPAIQALQSQELITYLAAETMPVIVMGDFNSSPDDDPEAYFTPPYYQLVGSGYLDTWLLNKYGISEGYTCCQDEKLDNVDSVLDERVDHVFIRSDVEDIGDSSKLETKAVTLGDKPEDKTGSGMWPSDHAGVYVKVKLPVSTQ